VPHSDEIFIDLDTLMLSIALCCGRKGWLDNDTDIRNFSYYSGISTQWLLWHGGEEYRVGRIESATGREIPGVACVAPYFDFLL